MNILEKLESLYYNTYGGSYSSVITIVFILLGLILLLISVISILGVVGQWKVFKKAGEQGWKALIPIYNTYTMCKLVGVSPWWILINYCVAGVAFVSGALLLSNIVSLYFSALLAFSIAKSYGKEDTYGIGLFFLYPIFIFILGRGKEEYIGPRPIKDIIFNKNVSDDIGEANVSEVSDKSEDKKENKTEKKKETKKETKKEKKSKD